MVMSCKILKTEMASTSKPVLFMNHSKSFIVNDKIQQIKIIFLIKIMFFGVKVDSY